jgi:hypothetical protein
MFNNKILIILLLKLHLTISLKSTHLCMIKQQECKGFYDENKNYEIKCEPIKCHGAFNFTCGLNICSNKKSECDEINKFGSNLKYLQQAQYIYQSTETKYLNEKESIDLFNKHIRDCGDKVFNFDSNDFCIKKRNCMKLSGFGYLGYEMLRKTECKCPSNKSFQCGKLCSIDSNACDFLRSKDKKYFNNIKHCNNLN